MRAQKLSLAMQVFNQYCAANGISAQNATVKDTTIYITADLKGKGGIVKLIDPNTKKIEGKTNLEGNKLDKGRFLLFDSIRGLYEDTELTVEAAKWDSATLAAVRNSELRILQGADGEILSLPLMDIFNLHRSNVTDNGEDFRDLAHFPMIKPEVIFDIQWAFPLTGGVSGAVTAALARLELRATEIFIK